MEQNLLEILTSPQLTKKYLTPWKPNVHHRDHKTSMQVSKLRLIILTLPAGVSKVVSVFKDFTDKIFLRISRFSHRLHARGCSCETGGGDSVAAPDRRVQGVVKWTEKKTV
jgi:hypothetical protein